MSREEAKDRLRTADWLKSTPLQKLFGVLDGEAGRTRAVGGIVRDTLIGRAVAGADLDLATELVPEEVVVRVERSGFSAHPTGIDHGTVTVTGEGLVAEVTTLREDISTDGRRATVRFGTDWAQDARRRDFTLNALYAAMDGTLHDPLGGLADCVSGQVRFIGDPDERIAEDRLRVFRFFRFSASHGGQRFDAEGLSACRRAAGSLGRLSAERVGAEMRRMLSLPRVALTLQAMDAAGVLSIGPEALRWLTSYEERSERPSLAGRLAILFEAGDPEALRRSWRLSNAETDAATAIGKAEQLIADGEDHEALYRYPDAIGDAIDIGAVRRRWPAEVVDELRRALAGPARPKLPIAGGDLVTLGYRPGRALGAELSRLEREWIHSGFTLDRAALLARVTPPAG